MTPRCVNCIHWDEDTAHEDGLAFCFHPDFAATKVRRGELVVLERGRTSGDYSCPRHEYNSATVGTSRYL